VWGQPAASGHAWVRKDHQCGAIEREARLEDLPAIATDTFGCRTVLSTAEEAKAKKISVVVGQRRYSMNYREAQKRIVSGALGTIVSGRGFYLTGAVSYLQKTP
jgi:myo-inositol 2-dehydrogenase/D-chiro-inositol 1-dehydrogenase